MVAFVKYEVFVTDMATGNHTAALNADTDVLKVALTNTAPNVATHNGLADITEITAGNGYTAGGEDAANAATTTTGTITVVGTDITWTASGGSINQFRYCVLYNDTTAGDDLIGYWDNGSAVDLATGESFTLNFGASMFTIA